MLPRRAAQTNRPCFPRLSTLSTSILVLLALCVSLPFVLYTHHSSWDRFSQRQQPPATPLQRLQQQRISGFQQLDPTATSSKSLRNEVSSSAAFATADQVAAASGYLHRIQHPKQRPAVPASKYVLDPEPFDMRQQHKKVKAYLNSGEFAARQAARKARGGRGIIINAGGPQLLSSAIVAIKVLREHLNCTLPIELVWHTPSEMDPATLSALQEMWGPITGVDLSSKQWPAHHRNLPEPAAAPAANAREGQHTKFDAEVTLPAERAAAKQRAFAYKVWSLAATSFASALLLDADNLPLTNPEGLWEDVPFKLHGNLFWPDFWPPGTSSEAQDVVYDMVGLDATTAAELLAAGKGPGMSWRATESGQVLLDLAQHGDVAEWALWINTFGDTVYRALWGDKDTYSLAFAVAGKAHAFNQLQVPPAGAFAWRPSSVLVKATEEKVDGWQLAGMVQYDAWGQAAFLHRTMNKLSVDGEPWAIGLLTAPLQLSWIQYYLSLDSLGPTVGVPVIYAAPASAFKVTHIQPSAAEAAAKAAEASVSSHKDDGDQPVGCPHETFKQYWALRQQAVPLGPIPTLDTACTYTLHSLLGPLSAQYRATQLVTHPELLAVGLMQAAAPSSSRTGSQHYGYHPTEPPNPSPVVAWAVSEGGTDAAGFRVAEVMQSSLDALDWLKGHAVRFPLLAVNSSLRDSASSGSSGA